MTEFIDGKRILTMPVTPEDTAPLKIGDVFYLTGELVTCRDEGHKRCLEEGLPNGRTLKDKAVLHAGPIVSGNSESGWEMISVGPTTSMRMEKYEKDFIQQTGCRIIIGKGGMGEDTKEACVEHKAVHCVFPGGCAVVAAGCVDKITALEWADLGMPEAYWVMEVTEFGPLTVSIDTYGNNLYKNNRDLFKDRSGNIIGREISLEP